MMLPKAFNGKLKEEFGQADKPDSRDVWGKLKKAYTPRMRM
jgi:hypothetical protein